MNYPKVTITGTLETTTPLHIGSGGFEPHETYRKPREGSQDASKEFVASLCADYQNHPYIPGSTIKGMLRSIAQKEAPEQSDSLFGVAKPKKNDTSNSSNTEYIAGRLYVYDAAYRGEHCNTEQRMSIAIDPLLGTAKEGALFAKRIVPVGSKFSVELQLEKTNESELEELLRWLSCFDGGPASQLGAGQNQQMGRLKWCSDLNVTKTTPEALLSWLSAEPGTSINTVTDPRPIKDFPEITSNQKAIAFQVATLSPLLCADKEWGSDAEGQADLSWMRTRDPLQYKGNSSKSSEDFALIPASTLLGWLRGRCRKILMTWIVAAAPAATLNQQNGVVDGALAELFGNEKKAGLIGFSDAKSLTEIRDKNTHTQTFNAVDRFTGAVSDGALYTMESIVNVTFASELVIRNTGRFNSNPWRGLLLFALRDAMEGDLLLGWGKAKGYGHCQLTRLELNNNQYQSWEAIYQALQKHPDFAPAQDALNRAKQQLINQVTQQQETGHVE